MNKKWTFSLVLFTIIIGISIFFLGFNKIERINPQTAYTVYLDGNIVGLIDSKENFENYINDKEAAIKTKYGVDTIYEPKGVEIKKSITYNPTLLSYDEIYRKITDKKDFTIKGITVTISNKEKKDYVTKKINVLSKKIFDDAMNKTVKAFINADSYEKFINGDQAQITETGSQIESVSLEENVSYKETLISTDEKIFNDVDELAKYLLYGTTDKQETYTVQEGDTIEDVANSHKLNVNEFLIANPEFTSVNNLLYSSQQVVVGLINPIVSVVEVVHAVEDEEKLYDTEVQYDSSQYAGYQYVERDGENGLYRVTRKYQYINGQLSNAVVTSTSELKPSVSRILIKGEKYAPSVADLSYWAWPTNTPYSISSGYEYRWGSFHGAVDIIGPGFGSPIYAANNGVVVFVGTGCTPGDTSCNGGGGNHIIINHNAGNYYTVYMHLNSIYVTNGQTVARGQKIGTMGNTGSVDPVPSGSCPYCGTHLHFALYIGHPYQGGYYIYPLSIYQ